MLYKNRLKLLKLERFCFPVTLRCDLRCKLCAERSPYYEKPYHPALQELVSQIDRIFELADEIHLFDLTGGEPLLRKDLHELIQYLYQRYGQRIGRLRITTNGTLLFPEELLDRLKFWGARAYVIVDRYPVSAKVSEIQKSLVAADVPFEIRDYTGDLHCDGWVDYGDFKQKHTPAEAMALFQSCMVPKLGFFLCMVNGTLFPCARARLLYEQGITSDCLSIMNGSVNAVREELRRFLKRTSMASCAYCNGLCESSRRFSPAEQLEDKNETEGSCDNVFIS